MSLGAIFGALNKAGVEYIVIGGVAATYHGSARITFDIDICYNPTPSNRERLAKLLVSWHSELRGAERGLPFVIDARTLRDVPVLTLTTDEDDIDVMDRVAGVGEYRDVLATSEPGEIDGVKARVISLDGLIAAKKAAGRRKDQEALLELEALREIRKKKGLD